MKKIILLLMLVSASLFAELTNAYMTQQMLDSDLPIVDVRTVGEWKEEGLLKGAIPIEFFNIKGKYDINTFLKELNAKVDTTKPFAIICHTGSRTSMIANWMSKDLNYKVTNILGGMEFATKGLKMKVYPYKK
ncbi:rhodanese-like domain-containing protein [Sulfurimonas sp. SAG-AH-194-C21]|nr:rhodanese-like domain-containing protein [Sulfurimonas sp. SAG-AH-194-C21]MDF1882544.1 rhodanese-like domain-containing protein [Sulfurimonas sp. SAG-AH-194-C21]